MKQFFEKMAQWPRWVRVVGLVAVVALLLVAAGWAVLSLTAPARGQTTVQVTITSATPPTGVAVTIMMGEASELKGVTPWEVQLTPGGQYFYAVAAKGYRASSGYIDVPATGATTMAYEIPALEPAAQYIEVSSNALVDVFVDNRQVGLAGPDPAVWASFGPFAVGTHEVRAHSQIAEQTQQVEVVLDYPRKVELRWGSQLEVLIEPAAVLSATVYVDGAEYTAPLTLDAERLAVQPFADVEVEAPGYTSWVTTTFFVPGGVTLVTATLSPAVTGTVPITSTPIPGADPREAQVLASLARFWEVLTLGYQNLDASGFNEVMVGAELEVETQSVAALKATGLQSVHNTVTFVTTPTVTFSTDGTSAEVRGVYDWDQVFVLPDGSQSPNPTAVIEGVFTLLRGEGDAWLVAEVNSQPAALPTPVPSGTPGPGGGNGSSPPAASNLVASIIFQAMNCSFGSRTWDQELATAFVPLANEATSSAASGQGFSPVVRDKVHAMESDLGARLIIFSGIGMNYNPSGAEYGLFDSNWAAYASDACNPVILNYVSGFGGNLSGLTSLAVIVSTNPYYGGGNWTATLIIVGR